MAFKIKKEKSRPSEVHVISQFDVAVDAVASKTKEYAESVRFGDPDENLLIILPGHLPTKFRASALKRHEWRRVKEAARGACQRQGVEGGSTWNVAVAEACFRYLRGVVGNGAAPDDLDLDDEVIWELGMHVYNLTFPGEREGVDDPKKSSSPESSPASES